MTPVMIVRSRSFFSLRNFGASIGDLRVAQLQLAQIGQLAEVIHRRVIIVIRERQPLQAGHRAQDWPVFREVGVVGASHIERLQVLQAAEVQDKLRRAAEVLREVELFEIDERFQVLPALFSELVEPVA